MAAVNDATAVCSTRSASTGGPRPSSTRKIRDNLRLSYGLIAQFLACELRSRDRISFKVILSDELVRPKPMPASMFQGFGVVIEHREDFLLAD